MPREVEERSLRPSATSRYRFPGLRLPSGPGIHPDVLRFLRDVKQWIDLREGALGNAQERVVLKRDLDEAGLNNANVLRLRNLQEQSLEGDDGTGGAGGGGLGPPGNRGPGTVRAALEKFADSIVNTRVFQNLLKGINDNTRFNDFSAEVQAILLNRIDLEAKERGAAIRRIEKIQQTQAFSQAIAVQEVTAAVMGAMAGVRVTTFATAEAGRATAGQVTQLFASLDEFGDQVAAIEETMFVQADSILGLEAQYTLKLTAGGAIAGFGLAASSPVGGVPSSAAIFRVDRFAIVPPSYTGGLTLSPSSNYIPFGIDSTGMYVGVDILCRGRGYFDGVSTRAGFTAAGHFNSEQNATSGLVGAAGSGTGVIGHTGPAAGLPETSGSRGVAGFTRNTTAGYFNVQSGGTGTALEAINVAGGKRVRLATISYAVHSQSGEGKHYAVDGLGPFTGFHDALMPLPLLAGDYTPQVGDIAVDDELVEAPDVNNALFTAAPCSEVGEDGAIGIISETMELDDAANLGYAAWWTYQHTHMRAQVNGVGEGQVNVCGRGGNLTRGDLIVCSDLPGKGQRQEDRVVRSNTVARVRLPKGGSVVFSHPDEVKMVPCVYLCG
jgi:hypothetical protein